MGERIVGIICSGMNLHEIEEFASARIQPGAIGSNQNECRVGQAWVCAHGETA